MWLSIKSAKNVFTQKTYRCLAAVLAMAGLSSAVQGQNLPDQAFTPIPGVRELSGFLIARPLQRADAAAQRMPEERFQQLGVEATRAMNALGIAKAFPEVGEFVVRQPRGQSAAAVARNLLATGAFSFVEPDWIVFPVSCSSDPLFPNQWHQQANRLNTCAAWAYETGSPSVVVAICDTGVRIGHQDLLLNRQEGFHVPTQKWESAGGPVNDINGHGTLCTGSAAANGNNGVGVAGMGWNLGHRMMRVTDSSDGSASISNLTLAARTAADRGDKVVSVSYSGVTSSSVFTTGSYVRSKGALLVWAAGNSNTNLSGNREDSVIVVGATDQNDAKASFSSFGTLVDVVAPGVSIYTTSNGGNASYSSASGTSFATPIVAGLCGLIWSRNPGLSPAEVEAILRSTCKDLGSAGVDEVFGYGRVDASAALAATPAPGVDTTPPATPTGLAATVNDGEVSLKWNASPESDLAGYSIWRSQDNLNFTELTSSLLLTPAFTDVGLTNGTTYHYAVYAVDLNQNESAPARVSATPAAPPQVATLASENFESGTLANTSWVVQNSNAFVSSDARFEGSFGLRLRQSTWAEIPVSTVGFQEISVSYARRTIGLTNRQSLRVEWWNGRKWNTLESVRTDNYSMATFVLPSVASNLSSFRLRFSLNGSNTSHLANLDDIKISGRRL